MSDLLRIPLFPLNLVHFPTALLPLHIFEERYREMIGECLELETVFGVVLVDDKGLSNVGTTSRIDQVLKRYDDGRLDILTVGLRRFFIEKVLEERAFFEAEVRFLDDRPETRGNITEATINQSLAFLQELLGTQGQEVEMADLQALEIEPVSYLIASHAGFTNGEKQVLLEMTDTNERLTTELAMREEILNRTRLSQRLSQTMHSNGAMKNGAAD